jgi:hypothetical protein
MPTEIMLLYEKKQVYVGIEHKVERYEEDKDEHANIVGDRVEAPVVQVDAAARSGALQRIVRPANNWHTRPE